MLAKRQHNKRGLTLLEVLIAMTAGLLVLGGLVSSFRMLQNSYSKQEDLVEIMQTNRATMDTMSREIQMAGFNPTGASFDGIIDANSDGTIETADDTRIQILADLDEDGTISGSNENITYAYDSANSRITRNTGGGDQPFAENVGALDINYLKADGTAASTTSEVRQIEISITVQSPDGSESRTLTAEIYPRNLSITS